jgi:hypothetical protein
MTQAHLTITASAIPHCNLPRAHAELRRRGLLEHTEVRQVLAAARLVAGDRLAAA